MDRQTEGTVSVETGSSNATLQVSYDGACAHRFIVPLGCEPHDYRHLWGWACFECWDQAFYSELWAMCERGVYK